jgi:hypothetical protein
MNGATQFRNSWQIPAFAGMTWNPTNLKSGAAATEGEIRNPPLSRAAFGFPLSGEPSFLRKQESFVP